MVHTSKITKGRKKDDLAIVCKDKNSDELPVVHRKQGKLRREEEETCPATHLRTYKHLVTLSQGGEERKESVHV